MSKVPAKVVLLPGIESVDIFCHEKMSSDFKLLIRVRKCSYLGSYLEK